MPAGQNHLCHCTSMNGGKYASLKHLVAYRYGETEVRNLNAVHYSLGNKMKKIQWLNNARGLMQKQLKGKLVWKKILWLQAFLEFRAAWRAVLSYLRPNSAVGSCASDCVRSLSVLWASAGVRLNYLTALVSAQTSRFQRLIFVYVVWFPHAPFMFITHD